MLNFKCRLHALGITSPAPTLLMMPVNAQPLHEAYSVSTSRAAKRRPLPRVPGRRLGRPVLVIARRRGVEAIGAARRPSGWVFRNPSALSHSGRGIRVGRGRRVTVHLFHLRRDVSVADGPLCFRKEGVAVAGEGARNGDVFLGDGSIGGGVCVRVREASVPILLSRVSLDVLMEEQETQGTHCRKRIPGTLYPGPEYGSSRLSTFHCLRWTSFLSCWCRARSNCVGESGETCVEKSSCLVSLSSDNAAVMIQGGRVLSLSLFLY